jgi:nitric oxide reductase subunit B
MAALNNNPAEKKFIVAGLILLSAGFLFGLTGALQYILPGFLKQVFSFERTRPLHVSSIVFWILLCAIGAVFVYLQQHTGKKIYSPLLLRIQLGLFVIDIILIMVSYCFGVFGGREYWEFNPLLAIPIIAGWLLFGYNFIRSVGSMKNQPVYVWMWLTGIVFFLFTFLESYLWIFPYFSKHIVNDMTVQWKSYGSMVGAWNMLIYGSSLFLMEKISGNKLYARSKIAFILYGTGLFNLMFNWGHHIYTLPTHHYIQYISYAVSMTELFILGRIIFQWKSTLTAAQKYGHHMAYRFLWLADTWIFLNLLLAILMSIPAVNVYTHGTHITVAHAMGTTIGINSFLLLGIACDILQDACVPARLNTRLLKKGLQLTNGSLFVFWIALIAAGIVKSKWQMSTVKPTYIELMQQLRPYFMTFFFAGIGLTTGFMVIIIPLLRHYYRCMRQGNEEQDVMNQRRTEAA